MAKIGISSQLFAKNLLNPEHLRLVADSGFRVMEIFAAPGHYEWQDGDYVAQMARAMRELGLSAFSMHAPWAPGQDIAAVDPAQRLASIEGVLAAVDALRAMDGKILVLHPGATPSGQIKCAEQLALSKDSIEAIAAHCAERGALIALENPPPYELGGATPQMLGLYRKLAVNTTVQACFDTGHAHITPEGVAGVAQVPKEILLAHLSDNVGESDDHLMPGDGTIDWSAFLGILRQRDFDGCLMLELTDLPSPDRVLTQGWEWMRQALESIS
jgi:sugar phosphate isomerase/epimerase